MQTSAPIWAYADYNLPFVLPTDRSLKGLGAVLTQIQDGQELVINFVSRRFRKNEKILSKYSSFKLELLTVRWAITETFADILTGTEFLLLSDNNMLMYLNTAKLGALEQKLVTCLSKFNFKIWYRSGLSNTNANSQELPMKIERRMKHPTMWSCTPRQRVLPYRLIAQRKQVGITELL